MVIECLRCWWNGSSPAPVFFDAVDLNRHDRITHTPSEYQIQDVIAAPWIEVGFTYQAASTDAGELVLAYPYSPKETEASAKADPVREGMNLALATPQLMLWE